MIKFKTDSSYEKYNFKANENYLFDFHSDFAVDKPHQNPVHCNDIYSTAENQRLSIFTCKKKIQLDLLQIANDSSNAIVKSKMRKFTVI